jgi:hypothetical protein
MELIVAALVLGAVTGLVAQNKGYEFAPWFVFGALFFLPAIIIILLRSPAPAKVIPSINRRVARLEASTVQSHAVESNRFNCPQCGESIPVVAKICRFCNYDLTTEPVSPAEAAAALKAELPAPKPVMKLPAPKKHIRMTPDEEFFAKAKRERATKWPFFIAVPLLLLAIGMAGYYATHKDRTPEELKEMREEEQIQAEHIKAKQVQPATPVLSEPSVSVDPAARTRAAESDANADLERKRIDHELDDARQNEIREQLAAERQRDAREREAVLKRRQQAEAEADAARKAPRKITKSKADAVDDARRNQTKVDTDTNKKVEPEKPTTVSTSKADRVVAIYTLNDGAMIEALSVVETDTEYVLKTTAGFKTVKRTDVVEISKP